MGLGRLTTERQTEPPWLFTTLMLQPGLPGGCLVFGTSHPSGWSGDQGEGELTLLWGLHAPCFTLGLPGENFLLVIAGFPMPILGMNGIRVVVVVVGGTLLWSPGGRRLRVCRGSLGEVPGAGGEERAGDAAAISPSGSGGFSSDDGPGLGMLSGVVSISSSSTALEPGEPEVSTELLREQLSR